MFVAQRKDVERARARELRAEGLSLREIGRRLGVSYSSVSLWVRDVPLPPPDPRPAVRDGERRWCPKCEQDRPLLEFDHHLGEKERGIANLLAAAAKLERIERELERCEVVCASCHRRRTCRRLGSFRATGVVPAGWTAAQERNQRFVLDHLRRAPCVDCGEPDPVVLEFDHVGAKRADVTRLAAWSSLARLQEEIAACEVRCVNCHRLRTLSAGPAWRDAAPWAAA